MMCKQWFILSVVFYVLVLSSCAHSVDPIIESADPAKAFTLILQEGMDHSFDQLPGVSMTVESSLLSDTYSGAVGFSDIEKSNESSANQPFRIASVTKTFIAASILRLHEMDSLSIEDPISKYIDESLLSLLRSDQYDPDQILIKHCLNHTSGLFDYAIGHPAYIEHIMSNPKKIWTRKDQIEWAVKYGDKLGPPGGQTSYCDTGYILLGAIVEKYFSGNLARGMRELLHFDRLGLDATWLETKEGRDAEEQDLVHRYHGIYETTEWHASIDLYGGGGLVSTTKDLSRFFYALFNHDIFDKKETLALMLSEPEYVSSETNDQNKIGFYNYGLWTIKVFDEEVHMHTGFWGTSMMYLPAYDASISVNVTKGKPDRLVKKTIQVLKVLKEKS